MHWLILIVSAVFESVWAIALSYSHGFTLLVPTIVFFIALVLSMSGLAFAVKEIPVGTGYSVWVGIGASLTVIYSMATGMEDVSALKIVFLVGIVVAVAGLKASSEKSSDEGVLGNSSQKR